VITRTLSWFAVLTIGAATLLMLAVDAAGPSRAVVRVPRPAAGPPWDFNLHPSSGLVTLALWIATIGGGAGVAAGIAAVSRGARPPVRWMVAAALTVTALFAVFPVAGSTDALDYASYGRMVVLGHNPYVTTPYQMRRLGDPVARVSPHPWLRDHSAYGPLASAEQAAAAALGGTSAARITFWLKLWTALAFGAVVLALDRLLRGQPARRARAHLLWSLNPLLLWDLVAAGHVDGLAAALGFFGLVVTGLPRPGVRRDTFRALAAGVLVGAAADIKVNYALLGVGLFWAARKSRAALAAAAAGVLAVLVPSYLWLGKPALTALTYRSGRTSADNFYQIFTRALSGQPTLPAVVPVAAVACVAVACLLLWRLPGGPRALPAVRPALAVSLAWLFFWPYQRPWYDAMMICLLALYPATAIDWPVLARLVAGTFFTTPGMPGRLPRGGLSMIAHLDLVPVIRFGAAVTLVALGILWMAAAAGWGPRARVK
jgi:hypothetical protein